MATAAPPESEQYDAFISYSSHDSEFARVLEKTLEVYKPPKGLNLHLRYLRIFRYEGDMTGVEYDKAIQDKIQKSAKLIVICSPAARQSEYVDDEIRRFVQAKGAENIIPIMLDGIPNNEAAPGQTAEMAFPEALCQVLEMPLAVTYLGFNPRQDKVNKGMFNNSWYNLLANLYDRSREDIEQREIRRRAKRLRTIAFIVAGIFILLSAALVVTVISRQEAVKQRDNAVNALGRIFSERAWQHYHQDNRFLAAKYALAGWRFAPSTGADQRLILASILQEANESLAVMEHPALPLDAVFSPNGALVATTCEDGEVRLWDSQSGKPVKTFKGHDLQTTRVVFSPDGSKVASASNDGTVRIWEPTSGREVRPFLELQLPGILASFSSDSDQIVTVAEISSTWQEEKRVSLWNVSGGSAIWTVSPKTNVLTTGFAPDGKGVVTIDETGTAQFWDRNSGKRYDRRKFGDVSGVAAAAFSPANDLVILGYANGNAKAFRFSTSGLLKIFKGPSGAFSSINIAPSGKKMVTGGTDGIARSWDLDSGRELARLIGHKGALVSVAFSADGKWVTTASRDKTVRVWQAGRRVAELEQDGEVKLAFSKDGTRMATATGTSLQVFDLPTLRCLTTLSLRFDAELNRISETEPLSGAVSYASDNKQCFLVNVNKGEIISKQLNDGLETLIYSSMGPLFASALAPEGPMAAVVTMIDPHRVQLINTTTREKVTLPGQIGSFIRALSFSRNGLRLLAGGQNGGIYVWNTASKEPIMNLPEPASPSGDSFFKVYGGSILNGVALNGDGNLAAFLLRDGTARVWDVNLKKQISVLQQDKGISRSVAFSPDSSLVIAGGPDGAQIWDVGTGHMLAQFNKPTSTVSFTRDGRYVVLGGCIFVIGAQRFESKTTEVWDVGLLSQPLQALVNATCKKFLTSDMHHFDEFEIDADPLIRETWLKGHTKNRSLCNK